MPKFRIVDTFPVEEIEAETQEEAENLYFEHIEGVDSHLLVEQWDEQLGQWQESRE